MKVSELRDFISKLDDLLYSPLNSGMILGCDCGCGGNNYSPEEYDKELEDYSKLLKEVKAFCKENNLELDYDFT